MIWTDPLCNLNWNHFLQHNDACWEASTHIDAEHSAAHISALGVMHELNFLPATQSLHFGVLIPSTS